MFEFINICTGGPLHHVARPLLERTAYGTQQRKSLCLLQQLEVEQPQRLGEKGVEGENKHMQQRAVDEDLLDLLRV